MRTASAIDPVRYSRHLTLPGVGPEGQEKLSRASVAVVGAGGLGSSACLYLAAAGLGHLRLIDPDAVELSNLQRQILYSTPDVGSPKAACAARRLAALNPGVRVETFSSRLDETNADALLSGVHFVLACTDNLASKFAVNDVCLRLGVPFCIAGAAEFRGQAMTCLPGRTACWRCLFPEPEPPPSSPPGILGAVAGLLGCLQAAEALKHLLGVGQLLSDRLLGFDALGARFHSSPVTPNPRCPACKTARAAHKNGQIL